MRSALHAVEGNYDLVVVDAAPQLNLVTINVLNTVGELIVPVDAGLYSIVGLGRLEETIDQVRRFLDNRELRIAGLVLTRAHHNRATKDLDAPAPRGLRRPGLSDDHPPLGPGRGGPRPAPDGPGIRPEVPAGPGL